MLSTRLLLNMSFDQLGVLLGVGLRDGTKVGEISVVERPRAFSEAKEDGLDEGTIWMIFEEDGEAIDVDGGVDDEEMRVGGDGVGEGGVGDDGRRRAREGRSGEGESD